MVVLEAALALKRTVMDWDTCPGILSGGLSAAGGLASTHESAQLQSGPDAGPRGLAKCGRNRADCAAGHAQCSLAGSLSSFRPVGCLSILL